MMKGSDLMQEVREETQDLSFDSYSPINRAYEHICEKSNPYWLSETKEGLINFEANQSEYYLDFSKYRSLRNIKIAGTYNGQYREKILVETDEVTFDKHREANVKSNGDDLLGLPTYYKLEGAPVTKITVTPVPDSSYTTTVHFSIFPEEIEANTEIKIPEAYHRKIVLFASGYILRKSPDPAKRQEGMLLINDAEMSMKNLFRDTKPNRSGRIQPPQQRYKY